MGNTLPSGRKMSCFWDRLTVALLYQPEDNLSPATFWNPESCWSENSEQTEQLWPLTSWFPSLLTVYMGPTRCHHWTNAQEDGMEGHGIGLAFKLGHKLHSAEHFTAYKTLSPSSSHLILPAAGEAGPKLLRPFYSSSLRTARWWPCPQVSESKSHALSTFPPSVWDSVQWSATRPNLGMQTREKLLIDKRSPWKFCIPFA